MAFSFSAWLISLNWPDLFIKILGAAECGRTHAPVISVLGKLRREDGQEFDANQRYIMGLKEITKHWGGREQKQYGCRLKNFSS